MLKYRHYMFIGREPGKADGKLRCRVCWARHTLTFNLGYRVDPDKWLAEAQRCKNNTTHGADKVSAAIINRQIAKYEDHLLSLFEGYDRAGIVPSAEQVKEDFGNLTGRVRKDAGDLFPVLDQFVQESGSLNHWTRATQQKFAGLKSHLQDFNPHLAFADLTEEGLRAYVEYLIARDFVNTTIKKQLSFLRWFLRWATAKGYNSQMAFSSFNPKLKTSKKMVIFLDWEELMQVYSFRIPVGKDYLSRVRDVFCFCCFTGLRYSDVANLKKGDVYSDYIVITTVKTADKLSIELNKYSRAILDQYAGQRFPRDRALPVISNQRMNDYLKELGKLCRLDKPVTLTSYQGSVRRDVSFPKYALLSTHAGRRTFICNALMLGIPAEVVMKWTGHSDYSAMKPYIEIADSAKKEAMKAFDLK